MQPVFSNFQWLLTLILSVVLSVGPGPVAASAESTELLPGFAPPYGEIQNYWSHRWPVFAESGVPWIRVYSQIRWVVDSYGPDELLYREAFHQKHAELDTLVRQAPRDLLSQVAAATGCLRWGTVDVCRQAGVFSRIISLDPDNLGAYLFELAAFPSGYGETQEDRAADADHPELRKMVLEASRATRWDRYSETASLDWYYANLNFVAEHPPPRPEQAQNPEFALAFWLNDKAPLGASQGLSVLGRMCPYWEKQEKRELKDACARLTRMLLAHHSRVGYQLRRDQLLLNDPFDSEGLRFLRLYTMYEDVKKCVEPHWIHKPSKWSSMDASIFENFLKTQAQSGRWEANRQAAIQDFISNPAFYPRDPADCEKMLQLDNEALAVLLGERDPVPRWVENQERLLEQKAWEDQPVVEATPTELAAMVEQLEAVDSVYDPVVKAIGRQGKAALPLLIEKLCAEKYLTWLSAAWSIYAMRDASTLEPLLESWAETRNEGMNCGEPTAIQFVMDLFDADFRQPLANEIDPDFHALLDLKVCDAGAEGLYKEVDSGGRPFKRYVITNGVSSTMEVECGGSNIELRPMEWERRGAKFKSDDVYVARLWVEILDLDVSEQLTPMPAFVEQYGSRPLALAHVVTIEGNSGNTELWVKSRDGWLRVAHLSSLIS